MRLCAVYPSKDVLAISHPEDEMTRKQSAIIALGILGAIGAIGLATVRRAQNDDNSGG